MKKLLLFVATLVFIGFISVPACSDAGREYFKQLTEDFSAGILPTGWDDPVNETTDESIELPKSQEEGGLEQFQDLVIGNLAQILRYLLVSIALFYAFLNVITMIFSSADESKVTEIKGNIAHIMLGLMLVGLAPEFVKIFDPATVDLIDRGEFATTTQLIINWISLIAGAVAILYMLISAIRLITAQGEESIIEEEKKDFKYGFVGLVVIIMADIMVNKVFYPVQGDEIIAPGTEQSATFAQELFQFLNYLLEFLAIADIIFMIVAGLYYVVSLGNDESTNKAKTILKNLVLGFIMIVFAYVVVSAVTPYLQSGQNVAQ